MNKKESNNTFSERFSFISRIIEATRLNPVLTRTLLALLTSTMVYGVLARHYSTVSAQEDWSTTNSSTLSNGTVPNPTPTPIPEEIWDQYRFSLKDENGVNPDDALITAFFVTEDGKELIFGPSRMEKDQEFHVASFAQEPGEVVEFELTTAAKADLKSYDALNNPVSKVVVIDAEPEASKAIFEITAAEEEVTAQQSPELTTLITTTLNTIDGDLMKVELDNLMVDSSLEVRDMLTGTITLDVEALTESAQAAKISGASAEGLNIGIVSGNAPEGMSGKFTLNGETYIFDSEEAFSSEGRNITVGPDGKLIVEGYDTSQPQVELFMPSVKVETE